MQIHGFSPLTLLDYPDKLACTIFCGNCNFRCPFCHNASLVLNPEVQPEISEDYILEHLKKRDSMLEGICVTGGEPTLYKDLPDFLAKLRETGLHIKLDTNGSNPAMIEYLIRNRLVDFIAMDIKACPDNYINAVGLNEFSMTEIFKAAEILMTSGIDYEFRTTVVNGIHSETDFIQIGEWLQGAKAYYLQRYKNSGDIIAPENLSAPTLKQMKAYRNLVLPYISNTNLRGTD